MKKRLLSFIIVLCVAFGQTALLSSAASYEVQSRGMIHFDMAFDTLTLINNERKASGAKALVMDKTLMNTALQRAAELSVVFSHKRPDGRSCFDGFSYAGSAAENIAYGFGSANDVYKAWKSSDGHHTNYINKAYTRTGLGCMYINGTYYWAQVFDNSSSITEFKKQSNYKATKAVPVTEEIFKSYAPASLPTVSEISYDSYADTTVKWTASTNTNGYRVYRYDTTTRLERVVATMDEPASLSYLDSGVKGGWTVQYRIRPYKKTGDITAWGSYSKSRSALIKPKVPNFVESSATANSVYLKWTKTNCDGFRLLVLNPNTGKYKLVAVTDKNTNSYTVTGLSPNTEYSFYVRTFYLPAKTYIYSAYSEPCTVRTSGSAAKISSEFFDMLEDDKAEEAA